MIHRVLLNIVIRHVTKKFIKRNNFMPNFELSINGEYPLTILNHGLIKLIMSMKYRYSKIGYTIPNWGRSGLKES